MRRTWLLHLGVVLGYVCVAIAFTWPLVRHLGTHLPGDPGGDTGVYVWNQWVFQHEALVAQRSPLSTDQILALSRRTSLAQHNYTAFLNLLALPIIPRLGVVVAFNLVFLGVTALTAYCTFLLARHLWVGVAESWIAGVAFAWAPVLVARSTGHISLVAAAPLPIFLLFLIRADRTGRVRDAVGAGLAVAWAAFCDVYYAVFCLAIAAGYVCLTLLRIRVSPRIRRAPWTWAFDVLLLVMSGLVVGLLFGRGGRFEVFGLGVSVRGLYTPVALLTMLVLLRVAFHLRPALISRPARLPALLRFALIAAPACAIPLGPVIADVAAQVLDGQPLAPPTSWRSSPRGLDLLAWFHPNPNHPLSRAWLGDGLATAPTVFVEYTAALSAVALAVVGFALWCAGFRPRAGWLWLTGGFAAMALGPFVHVAGVNTYVPGPWALLRYVPILGAARTPTRFSVVVALGLAVLLAGALAALGQRWPAQRRMIIAVAGALLVFELWPAPRPLYSATIPEVYSIIARDPNPVRVLELPIGFRDGTLSVGDFTARSQFHQTRHGKPLIGGYLSRISRREIAELRATRPTLDALLTLSEGTRLAAAHAEAIIARGPGFIERAQVGYVVIDHSRASAELVRIAHAAFGLEPVAESPPYVLYRPKEHSPSARSDSRRRPSLGDCRGVSPD